MWGLGFTPYGAISASGKLLQEVKRRRFHCGIVGITAFLRILLEETRNKYA
jgi:hypothetical protein